MMYCSWSATLSVGLPSWQQALNASAQQKAVAKVNRVVADIEEELLKVRDNKPYFIHIQCSDSHLQLRMESFTLRS